MNNELYKGFTIGWINEDLIWPRLYAYNKNIDMSFSLSMTEIQRNVFDKLYNKKNAWKDVLIYTMKKHINNYLNYTQNERENKIKKFIDMAKRSN